MTFGQLLRSERERAGKSLREFARQLKLSPTYVSRVECGRENPMPPEVVQRAAAFLGADARELLDAALGERGALVLTTDLSAAHRSVAVLLAQRWSTLTAEQLGAIAHAIEGAA